MIYLKHRWGGKPCGRFLTACALISLIFCALPAAPEAAPADSIETQPVLNIADTLGRDSLDLAGDSLGAWSSSTEVPSFDFSGGSHSDSGWIWVVASILIVLGLLYLFLYLLKRFFYRPGGSLAESGQFELLQLFHLGPKKNLTLIRVCGRILLLGVTDNSINTLMEISDEEELQKIQAGLKTHSGSKPRNFQEIYQGLLSRMKP